MSGRKASDFSGQLSVPATPMTTPLDFRKSRREVPLPFRAMFVLPSGNYRPQFKEEPCSSARYWITSFCQMLMFFLPSRSPALPFQMPKDTGR